MKSLVLIILLLSNTFALNYGELLFNGNCITCHFKIKKSSAPSISEVKENYINAYPNESDFVKNMTTWILNPNERTSIMQHSIKEFELMPELAYEKYVLEDIARYIYQTDFSKQLK